MPKTSDQMVTSTRRRSVRQKPVKKEPPKIAPPPDSDEEVRMPEGYNPSDDSEEEYVPPAKKTKVSLTRTKRSKKQTSGSDSEPEEEENQKPKKKAQSDRKGAKQPAGRKSQSVVLNPQKNTPTSRATKQSKTVAETVSTSPSQVTKLPETAKSETIVKKEPEQHILCPFPRCSEKLKIDGNARFHLSLHYYDAGKFSENDILQPEDPGPDGKAVDEKGSKIRYSCHFDRCTKRKMGYKVKILCVFEICLNVDAFRKCAFTWRPNIRCSRVSWWMPILRSRG